MPGRAAARSDRRRALAPAGTVSTTKAITTGAIALSSPSTVPEVVLHCGEAPEPLWTWLTGADTVSMVGAETLDLAVRIAVYAAAGEMQREIADTRASQVTEADLRRAVRAGAQAQLGPV